MGQSQSHGSVPYQAYLGFGVDDQVELVHRKDKVILQSFKHKEIVNSLYANGVPDPSTHTKKVVPKLDSDKQFIFSSVSNSESNLIINAMEKVVRNPKEIIISQGEEGDFFYFLEEGHCDCLIDNKKVCEYNCGDGFGELALLYNAPRAATIKTTSLCTLWILDKQTFRYTITAHYAGLYLKVKNFISDIDLFKNFNDEQINNITKQIEVTQYKTNDPILIKGEVGQIFYIIKEGVCVCTDIGNVGGELELKSGDYFGERALLFDEPRAANVISKTDSIILAINKETFKQYFLPIKNQFVENLPKYVLTSLPQFNNHCSKEQRDQIIACTKEKTYQPNDIICKQGIECDGFYIVKEGSVKLQCDSSVSPALAGLPAKIYNKGDYFNENIFACPEKNIGTFIAVEKSVLVVVTYETFTAITHNNRIPISSRRFTRDDPIPQPSDEEKEKIPENVEDLNVLRILGSGSYGVVKLVEYKEEVYAMKVLSKRRIVDQNQQNNVMNEKNILMRCHHPFIQRLYATYKDQCALYMLLPFLQGGELFNYMWSTAETTSASAKFFSGCVISGLAYLHERNIIYRDLKPENLMIDRDGYVVIVDFGFAKEVQDKAYTLCGTPQYMAPEIVVGKGHNKAVDYWALGVLIYELLCHNNPFGGRVNNSHLAMCRNIMRSFYSFPTTMTDNSAKDLIGRLLQTDPSKRFGCLRNGANDIKNHIWFKGFDWNKLNNRQVEHVPWLPPVNGTSDTTCFEMMDDDHTVLEPFYGDTTWADDF